MRPSLLLFALLLAAALAGCAQTPSSASDFKGAKKGVADTIEQLQTAAQNRKPQEICSEVLARALVEKLKASGNACIDEMEKIVNDADDFELDVTAVTITGATATATVKARKGGREGAVTTFALAREDGQWRLTNLGAS
jgi:PBP1b-binding outer membrane lipoprotein LpoB